MINLTDKQTLELLDIALFQRDMAKQKLYQLETTEGPMADYNLEAYNKKKGELVSALDFWSAVVEASRSPVEARSIREDEQRRAMEAVRNRQHFYYGPDCIFCGCFGPIDSDEPCFDPDPAKQLDKHQKQIEGLQDVIEYMKKEAAVDGPVFNLGRAMGRADVAVELRKIIDPTDEQHLSLDGTLDIVRKLARQGLDS